ncbi:acetyl-CoA decarbonylase/synthase complex subunit gamma [Acetobacterium woodii]|uniref:Corrinoid/iron-sulfur protein, large subunit AcsC n=1 Tax=Acetobacterium woodii (strain ATCC 29683 / DSM 1030 / JCM 2381 / KCTC 1655 / WB1) TaxID=931626 RepID=H6LD19_ACEWD|nr:acetyl-CoA decarbonylase/synthase complex subunit gamma [Acetobacterium woodii]AFA47858.1 corrinoid/iron-sulfur protein, large subunit AcsC [Acetobacterium woodii DSM 1030]
MAVKGLDIFKLTPKSNCKECGFPTCMAFSMKAATGAVAIEKCPYISEESKEALSEATAPPMKTIKVGAGDAEATLGGETVLFRHEKTLVHKNLFAVELSDAMSDAEVDAACAKLEKINYDRIGEMMFVEVVGVRFAADQDKFVALVKKVADCGKIPMIITVDAEVAKAAVAVAGAKAIIMGATKDNTEAMVEVAKAADAVLGVTADSIEALHDLVEAIEKLGYKNLILNVGEASIKEAYANAIAIRTSAIKGNDRTFGYPSIVFTNKLAPGNINLQIALASAFVLRYGSIIVLEEMDFNAALPLFGLRQNIFTDPQKPMRVEPKVYEFNKPTGTDPVLVTVDFALSYFVVAGEIERSKVPAYLAIPDAGGYSVLTAWAAGKFGSNVIANFIKENNVADLTTSRKLILPGKVAVLQGDLAELLPEWEVVVGPNEAMQIPKFLRDLQA